MCWFCCWCWGCHWCCSVVVVTGIVDSEVFFVGLDGVGLVGVGVSLVGLSATGVGVGGVGVVCVYCQLCY